MAAWLTYLGLPADPDHIVLTAGAQHGLATSLAALVKPGDTLLVEDLTYSGIRLLSQQMHFKLKGVAMDAEGLKPEALEAACRTTRATVLYCMPRLQNPTSAVMSEKRRRLIAAVAEAVLAVTALAVPRVEFAARGDASRTGRKPASVGHDIGIERRDFGGRRRPAEFRALGNLARAGATPSQRQRQENRRPAPRRRSDHKCVPPSHPPPPTS